MKHRTKFSRIPIVLFLLLYTINTAPAQTTMSPEDIAEKALAATVYLEMKDKNGKKLGFGSGFFVQPNLIATNYHVIEGAAKGTAKLVGKSTTYKIEGVTATDKVNDLALIKVTAYGVKPLSLGDSDKVRIGEEVYVTGNPKGLEGTFSDGRISSRRDKLTKERLQMTAPISPGSSGGPVLNRKGEVIGVAFAGHKDLDAQSLNFAIPSTYLQKLLSTSKQTERFPPNISAETYLLWGNAKCKIEDYVGAIADYTRAILLQPDYAEAYNGRGFAKTHLREYLAAIGDFDKAIQLKSDYTGAYLYRGVAKVRLERYTDAIDDFNTVIRLEPDNGVAYLNRGAAKTELGKHFDAITDFDTVIRLKPDNVYIVNAYLARAFVKDELGYNSEAKKDVGIALQLAIEAGDENLKTKVEGFLRQLNE